MTVGDVKSNERGSGARFNEGKAAYDLIALCTLEDEARVWDYGRKKYASWNWAKGMQWSVPLGCILRHLAAWQRGEDIDPESGFPHLAHISCNVRMLTLYSRNFKEGDDRPKEWLGNRPGDRILCPRCKEDLTPKIAQFRKDYPERVNYNWYCICGHSMPICVDDANA